MTDAIAKAIYEGRNGRGASPWASLKAYHREPYILDAAATLRVLREPTDEMLNVGDQALCEAETEYRSNACWRAMINAR